MELRIVDRTDALTHLALVGKLDIAGVQEIELTLLSHTTENARPTIIDLSDVTYITSTGIRLLLSCAKALKAAGMKMLLLKPQPFVGETLESMGLQHAFPIVHDYDDAVEQLRGK